MGYRTLVIDLDVQGNTTHYLVGEIDGEAFPAEAQGVAGLFKQTVGSRKMRKNPDSFVWETPYENLYLMPSSPVLSRWRRSWSRATRFTSCATPWKSSTVSTTGCISIPRPNFNFYSKSALIAADSVLMPFDCDSFARQSLYSLMDNIAELQEDHNPDLEVEGIVINQFNSQARLPGELVAELEEEGYPVFEYLPQHLSENEGVPPRAPPADRHGAQPQADRAVPRPARGAGKNRCRAPRPDCPRCRQRR